VSRPRLRPRLNPRHQNQPGLETDFNVFGWRAEDDGGVLFGGNGVERLEVAQLERRRRFADVSIFAAERRAAAAPLLLGAGRAASIDISCLPGPQQQTRRTLL